MDPQQLLITTINSIISSDVGTANQILHHKSIIQTLLNAKPDTEFAYKKSSFIYKLE